MNLKIRNGVTEIILLNLRDKDKIFFFNIHFMIHKNIGGQALKIRRIK